MENSTIISATAKAPVNIATIKYWGKRDTKLILPINDSISVTLSAEHMCAKTTVAISSSFQEDRIWLNGKEESIMNPRIQNCLKSIKNFSTLSHEKLQWKVHICSENNFPTAAGLASSSAGFACLVFALAKIYQVECDVSSIARQGSGSACRSMYGGFVRWNMGNKNDGSDSIAIQIAPPTYWPELKVLILVVNDKQKKTSSTIGMQRSVETSQLLKYRMKESVKRNLEKMMEAISRKDFRLFAETTMQDSNQFHAVCLDTYPPAIYMNDTSHSIASFVHQYNDAAECYQIAYTYDAGPNACLFVLEKDVPNVLASIVKYFPSAHTNDEYIRGLKLDFKKMPSNASLTLDHLIVPGLLNYIICTEVGDGPILLPPEESMLDEEGLPNKCI